MLVWISWKIVDIIIILEKCSEFILNPAIVKIIINVQRPLGSSSFAVTFLQCQRVFDQPPHGSAHWRAQRICDVVRDLVQIRLDVFQTRIKHIVHLWLRGHLGKVLVTVNHLHDVDDFLAELLADFLSADLPLLFVGQVHHVHLDAPDLPRDAFIRKGPAWLLLLVELHGDLTHAITSGIAKSILGRKKGCGYKKCNFAIVRLLLILG